MAIYNHLAVAKVEQANVEFLETLVKVIEARDEYTRGHSDRVCLYALAIGRNWDADGPSLAHLRTGARLHDIGKIGIPDAILRKPGRLTPEWPRSGRHPEIAAEMLRARQWPPPSRPSGTTTSAWTARVSQGLRGYPIPCWRRRRRRRR